MSQEDHLGGWQQQIIEIAQQSRLGYGTLSEEQADWLTRVRVRLIWIVVVVSFAIVAARVFYLQVFEANQQLLLSESNHLEQVRIVAKRGNILDRKGEILAQSRESEEVETDGTKGWKREYPLGMAGASILGYLSEVTEDELGCHDGLCYASGTMIGRYGIEAILETKLRGNDGGIIREVDVRGEVVRERGYNASEPGTDVSLTIDKKLQEIAYNAMDRARVNDAKVTGAVVAMNTQGEVLALVSYPTFDQNNVAEYIRDKSESYFLNRAISGAYPPGSIYKLITAYAGLESGKVTADTMIEDTGEIRIGEYRYGTWNFDQAGKKEGELSLVRALARSNDIYFYRVGEMVGVNDLVKMSKYFGLGAQSGIELANEAAGLVPDPLWKERRTGEKWFLGNTYHMSIGQGDLLVTPIQIARMSVASVTGRLCKSHIIKDTLAECSDLKIPSQDIDVVKEGMKSACASGGTAFPFFSFDPFVLCKTGTAQHGGQKDKDDLPHAWITVAYPGENPEMILTVLVESGGEGSSVAGPIAKQILEEWKGLN